MRLTDIKYIAAENAVQGVYRKAGVPFVPGAGMEPAPKVEKPTAVCVENVVTMSCATDGATIKYSIDGGTNYADYSTPITIAATTTYKIYATKDGMRDSGTVDFTAEYVAPQVETPTAVCVENVVTMECTTDGATIKYSTDGGTNYADYSAPITITETTTYNIYAVKDGMRDSEDVDFIAEYVAPEEPEEPETEPENNEENE